MNSKPIITVCFKQGLRITSREKALEFYDGVFSCILIPFGETNYLLRVEPHKQIAIITREDIEKGVAPFIANITDEDGRLALHYRKAINQYLKNRETGWW